MTTHELKQRVMSLLDKFENEVDREFIDYVDNGEYNTFDGGNFDDTFSDGERYGYDNGVLEVIDAIKNLFEEQGI